MMRFPPPFRFAAPMVALFFGLSATWLDYRLNLDLDLARHFNEMRARAESSGSRLARESTRLIATNDYDALQVEIAIIPDVPEAEIDGVVDAGGRIIADSRGAFRGQNVAATPLAPAAFLINAAGHSGVERRDDVRAVVSAHPFHLRKHETGWALAVFDTTDAIMATRADAFTQLGWMASAMALLSVALWAVMHFGFAVRIGRLAESVLAFGEGRTDAPLSLPGGDEVSQLSGAISAMAVKLHEREAEQVRLEREVLEISEGERQRIGRDLHDGLGQRLTAASMTTNALATAAREADARALADRADDLGRQLREAIADARSMARGLAPVGLVDDGLVTALATLAASTSGGGAVRCVLECSEPMRVGDVEVAGHLYRIAQEAVNNALKHAAPSEVRIGLERRSGTVVLEIDDDGIGFDEAADVPDGIGLRVMRYRARLIGGALEIGFAPAGGTRISCQVRLVP